MEIVYLSDTNPVYKALEEALLKNQFGFLHDREYHKQMLSDDFESKRINQFFESSLTQDMRPDEFSAVRDRYFPDFVELPTRLDAPLPFLILKEVVSQLRGFLEKIGSFKIPPYACIPLGHVNAQCVEVGEQKTAFVLINSQLLFFCHQMSKGFATAIPRLKLEQDNLHLVAPQKAIRNHLKKCDLPGRIIHAALHAYCVEGDLYRAPFFETPKNAMRFADLFVTEMELFVFSHEISHLYQGHLSLEKRSRSENWSIKGESDADGLGFFFAATTLVEKGMPLRHASIGIFLFFGALLLGERYSALVATGCDQGFQDIASESHPSIIHRISKLASQVEYMTNGKMKAANLKSSLFLFLEELWAATMIAKSRAEELDKRT